MKIINNPEKKRYTGCNLAKTFRQFSYFYHFDQLPNSFGMLICLYCLEYYTESSVNESMCNLMHQNYHNYVQLGLAKI